ncbi:MAG: aminotransferase class IV [Verrucomicrobiae bacterium]
MISNLKDPVSQRLVYWNGNLIPESEARVSIYDSALMFGDVAFEMTRSFNKKQFKLREHLERLAASAEWLHIPLTYSIDEMEEACNKVIAANDPQFAVDDEHRLMINITRGLLGIYDGRVDVPSGVNFIVADFPLRWTVKGSEHLYEEGIDIFIPSQRMIPAQLLEPKAKNRNRIHYLMANIEASRYNGKNVWALLIDPDGFVTEGTGSNFFLVKDGTLFSPEPRNILRGISRQHVIELAAQMDIPFREKNLEPYDLMDADEAFFTCTPFCMLPATKFLGQNIGDGIIGPVFNKLISTWGKEVGVDILAQAKSWKGDTSPVENQAATPYAFATKSQNKLR